jgi:hypothetical protein
MTESIAGYMSGNVSEAKKSAPAKVKVCFGFVLGSVHDQDKLYVIDRVAVPLHSPLAFWRYAPLVRQVTST